MPVMTRSRALIAALAVVAALAIGGTQAGAPEEGLSNDPYWNSLVRVLNLLRTQYLKKLSLEEIHKVIEGGIAGMLAALDEPYNGYSPPRYTQIQNQDVHGEFYGIGVVIQAANPDNTGAEVITVFRGGPAYRAGIKPGDLIVEVDGEDVSRLPLYDIVSRIRGPKGTVVRIGVRRNGSRAILRFEIPREKIEIVSVSKTMLPGKVGYVAIETFMNIKVTDQLKQAVSELKKQGAEKLVLDLRDNSGGLLDQGCRVADAFLDHGTIVYTRSRGVTRPHCDADRETIWDGPMVVLVNHGSASASEIIAGALKDLRQVKVIGEKTFGKGVGQTSFQLPNGGEVVIVTFEWLTPNRRSIHREGITPDIPVKDTRFPDLLAFEGIGAPAGGTVELVVKDKDGRVVKRVEAKVDEEGRYHYSDQAPPVLRYSEVQGEALVDLEKDAILRRALEELR